MSPTRYAVIALGGRQWRVEPGTRLEVNRVPTAAGGELPVGEILAAHDGTTMHVGRPYVAGAKVICEVLEHRRGPKVVSYRFRRRENWRKTVGHRQPLTRLVVKEILFQGQAVEAKPEAAGAGRQAPKAASPKTAKRARSAHPAMKATKEPRHGA